MKHEIMKFMKLLYEERKENQKWKRRKKTEKNDLPHADDLLR